MNVCFGYEKLSDKKKIEEIDRLIASFKKMNEDALKDPFYQGKEPFKKMISDLETERAEVTSRIGRK